MTSPRIPAAPPSLPPETSSTAAAESTAETRPGAKRNRSTSPLPAGALSSGQPSRKKQKTEIAARTRLTQLTAAEKFAALPELHTGLYDYLQPKEYARFLNEAGRARAARDIKKHTTPPESAQRKDLLRNAFRYTITDAVLTTYKRYGRKMLKDPDILRRLAQEMQHSEISFDNQFKLLMRLPDSHVRTGVVENLETACRQELVAEPMEPDQFDKGVKTIVSLIESWPETVCVASSDEASRLTRLTLRYQRKLEQWPENRPAPELTVLIEAWAHAFQAGTFDAGEDWRAVARILHVDPATPASAGAVRRNQLVQGISHWQRQGPGLRRLAPVGNMNAATQANQATRQAQALLHALAHDTSLTQQERFDLLNTITDTLMITHEQAGMEISLNRPLYRTACAVIAQMGLGPQLSSALTGIIKHPRLTPANGQVWMNSLNVLVDNMALVPRRTRASILESLGILLVVTATPFSTVAPFYHVLLPHVATMPHESLGKTMAHISIALDRGRASFSELRPSFNALADKIDVMPAEHLGIAMESLSSALSRGHAPFAELVPLFRKLIARTDGIPASRLGQTMAKFSFALGEGRVAFGEIQPILSVLEKSLGLMAPQHLGETMGHLSSSLGQGRATFAELGLILSELMRRSDAMPPQDLGDTLENLSSALAQGRATLTELEPIFRGLADKFNVLPPDHLGHAMVNLAVALARKRATFAELQPFLLALKDKADVIPPDDLVEVMDCLSSALSDGYERFTLLQPIFLALKEKIDTLPARRLGRTMTTLSFAVGEGRATFTELKPIFIALTDKVRAMPHPEIADTMGHLSFALVEGHATFAELKPLFVELAQETDTMQIEQLGQLEVVKDHLLEACDKKLTTFTEVQPVLLALQDRLTALAAPYFGTTAKPSPVDA